MSKREVLIVWLKWLIFCYKPFYLEFFARELTPQTNQTNLTVQDIK